MKTIKIPETDSIKELARFFETHDSIDFEDELAEVTEPLILPGNSILLRLKRPQAAALKKPAAENAVAEEQLVRQWVVQRITGVYGLGGKQRAGGRGRKPGLN